MSLSLSVWYLSVSPAIISRSFLPKFLSFSFFLSRLSPVMTIWSLLLSLPLSMVSMLIIPSIKIESLFLPRLIFVFPVSLDLFLILMISLPSLPLMVSDFAVVLVRLIWFFFASVLIVALFVSMFESVSSGRLPLLSVNVGFLIFSPVMAMLFSMSTDIFVIVDSTISVVSLLLVSILRLSTCD